MKDEIKLITAIIETDNSLTAGKNETLALSGYNGGMQNIPRDMEHLIFTSIARRTHTSFDTIKNLYNLYSFFISRLLLRDEGAYQILCKIGGREVSRANALCEELNKPDGFSQFWRSLSTPERQRAWSLIKRLEVKHEGK